MGGGCLGKNGLELLRPHSGFPSHSGDLRYKGQRKNHAYLEKLCASSLGVKGKGIGPCFLKGAWELCYTTEYSFYNPILFENGKVSLKTNKNDFYNTPRKNNKNEEKGKEILYIYKRL